MLAMIGLFVDKEAPRPVWPELKDEDIYFLSEGSPPIQVATLEEGTMSGAPSIAIRVDLPNGKTVIVETSAKLFVTMARAIHAKYPELLK